MKASLKGVATASSAYALFVALTLAALVVLAGGAWFYHAQERHARRTVESEMRAVTQLKADQIVQWRAERLADANQLMGSHFFVANVARWIADQPGEIGEKIVAQFRAMRQYNHGRDIMLVDRRGQIRLSVADRFTAFQKETVQAIAAAFQTRQPVFTDLYLPPNDVTPLLDVITPLFLGNEPTDDPVGALVMQYEARQFLYPLTRSWTALSRTAETQFVRRDGLDALFLNELRQQSNAAFTFRIPLSRTNAPAVQAVLGQEGVFQGTDYRGAKVLSVLKRIPNTSWYMVTKIDEAEALAEWRFRANLIVAVMVALTLTLVATALMIWGQRNKYRVLSQSAAALRKANRAYRVLSEGNQALVRADDEKQLLNEICQLLVVRGSYRLAWVGYVEMDEAKTVRPVAQAGFEDNYLESLHLTWADTERGRGPSGVAIRGGKPVAAQDILNDPSFVPWCEQARQRGYAASIALPLTDQGRAFGVLNVYAAEALAFDEQERELLMELANDLAFGIMTLRLRADQRRQEQALRLSREDLNRAQRVAKTGSWRLDLRHNTLLWSEETHRIFGVTEDGSLSYETFLGQVHPEDRKYVDQRWKAALQGEPYDIEHRIMVNGQVQWVRERAELEFDQAGTLVEGIGTAQDITETKLATEKVRAQAQLLDLTQDAILVRTLAGVVNYWNKGAEKIYGWTAGEVVGRDADGLFFEPGKSPTSTCLKQTLETGQWNGEQGKRTKAGESVTVQSRWTLLRDAGGQAEAVLIVDTDITEQKKLQAQFLRAQRLEAIGALASGIAHDLNNILAPVLMTATMLHDKVKDTDSRAMLKNIESCAQRGADIIKQLLTFARGTPGTRVSLPLQHLLSDMNKIMRETFPRDIHSCVNIAKGLWPVLADATQLHQVLMNLCVNARDAMPDGGTLTLLAENVRVDQALASRTPDVQPGNYVCVSVRDTGTGIAPENLERIFDPFFTTKEIGKGTGLGLATVMRIVRGHGGFVQVESQLGQGTTFRLYFPASSEALIASPASAEVQSPCGQGELILVVDDETIVREVVCRTLENQGYRVVTAATGAEGLSLFSQHRTEVRAVLTDMMMPIMNGPTMINALRAIKPGLLILGMSGLPERAEIKGLEKLELSVMLTKPFSGNELLNALHFTLHSIMKPS